jgi:hypothetical protein
LIQLVPTIHLTLYNWSNLITIEKIGPRINTSILIQTIGPYDWNELCIRIQCLHAISNSHFGDMMLSVGFFQRPVFLCGSQRKSDWDWIKVVLQHIINIIEIFLSTYS